MRKILGLLLSLILLNQAYATDQPAPKIKIMSATYGAEGKSGKWVTELLQAKINPDDTKIILSGTNMGVDKYDSWPNNVFGDPLPGVGKTLTVQYIGADGVIRSAACGEHTPLTLEIPQTTGPSASAIKIINAIYGAGKQSKDVTAALQAKIPTEDTKAVLSGTNIGVDQYGSWPNKIFGDPAFGQGKTLTVLYTGADGRIRTASCGERDALTLEVPQVSKSQPVEVQHPIEKQPEPQLDLKKAKEQEEFTELTVTDEFISEPGKFKRISAGLRKNKEGKMELEAWALDEKGIPHRYNPYAGFPYEVPTLEQENPWEIEKLNKGIASLIDISTSQHGNMVAIDNEGEALKYDWEKKVWNILPSSNKNLKLSRICIADKNHIYATSHDNILYEYDIPKTGKASWIEYKINPEAEASKSIGVAAGIADDKKTVILICLSDNGKAYEAGNKKWEELTGATNLVEVTIGSEDHIFAIDKNGLLWKLDYKDKKWEPVENKDKKQCCGFSYISANAAGTLFALDSDGDNYIKEAPAKIESAKKIAAKPGKKEAHVKGEKLTRAQAAIAGKTQSKPIQHNKIVKTPTKATKLVAKTTKKEAKKTAKKEGKKTTKKEAKKTTKKETKKAAKKEATKKSVTHKTATHKTTKKAAKKAAKKATETEA